MGPEVSVVRPMIPISPQRCAAGRRSRQIHMTNVASAGDRGAVRELLTDADGIGSHRGVGRRGADRHRRQAEEDQTVPNARATTQLVRLFGHGPKIALSLIQRRRRRVEQPHGIAHAAFRLGPVRRAGGAGLAGRIVGRGVRRAAQTVRDGLQRKQGRPGRQGRGQRGLHGVGDRRALGGRDADLDQQGGGRPPRCQNGLFHLGHFADAPGRPGYSQDVLPGAGVKAAPGPGRADQEGVAPVFPNGAGEEGGIVPGLSGGDHRGRGKPVEGVAARLAELPGRIDGDVQQAPSRHQDQPGGQADPPSSRKADRGAFRFRTGHR